MQFIQNIDKLETLILAQRGSGVLCEHLLKKIYQMHLKPGNAFIDVGARVGHHLFPMSRLVGPTGKGIGIEANPAMAKGLKERMKSLKLENLEIEAVAAGRNKGEAAFFVMEEYTGWSSLYEQHIHPNETKKPKKINVQIETIDDLFLHRKWETCDFIKLDIENAEIPALMGATKTLETYKPVVVFENSPKSAASLNNYTAQEFFNLFEDINYELFDIFLNKFTIERWKNDKMLPSYYLALPSECELFKNNESLSEYDDFLKECVTGN